MDMENCYDHEEDYDILHKRYKTENEKYLEIFESQLRETGLSEKTIRKHVSNADFYLNDFLLYGDPFSMEQGCEMVDEFLGDFFIRKCMWSTPGTIKSTSTSIKKFYKCMADNHLIEKDRYTLLCGIIKDNMEEWQDNCSIYNDPDAVNPFSFSMFF